MAAGSKITFKFPNYKIKRTRKNICLSFNPLAAKKRDLKKQESNYPSIFIGEFRRSVQERGQELPHIQAPDIGTQK